MSERARQSAREGRGSVRESARARGEREGRGMEGRGSEGGRELEKKITPGRRRRGRLRRCG